MRSGRLPIALLVLVLVLLLLHGLPWWLLVMAPGWSAGTTVVVSLVAGVALVLFPVAMVRGHGRAHRDRWAIAGDVWLGVIFQLFAWSVPGAVVLGLAGLLGAPSPAAARAVAIAVCGVVVVLCVSGFRSAMRVPRVRRAEIVLGRLDAALDGLRVVLLADTHYGPIDRSRWSRRLVDLVNGLDADVVAHAGDLADGSVPARRGQVAPLGEVRARHARVYITGNHEYLSGAVPWVEEMAALGWTVLHNRHVIVERDGASVAFAGVDDRTAASSGIPGHGADLASAVRDIPSGTPIVVLAHQPKQVAASVTAGADLHLSGHTHGGQIWPFHLLVRAEQGALQGLSLVGERTQLYVTRGAGFWGPPFRVFAPSDVSLLVLRAGALP